jgi:2-keto-3-deoxy-L-rhamnonate aldolase RhmA
MINKRLSDLLAANKPAIGTVVGLRDSLVAIILANSGFDWVWIDQEHNPFTETQLQMMIYALRGRDITPVIRVRENAQGCIKIALDMGAGGVMVPQSESIEEVREAVQNAKYPPLGKRGYGPMHATDFWHDKQEYDRTANDVVKCIIQIENMGLIDKIDDVLAIPGVDAVFVGPADLSWSMGLKGDNEHPDVEAAIAKLARACHERGVPWGMPCSDTASALKRFRQGARLLSVGADRAFIQGGSKQLIEGVRKGLDSTK